MLVYCPLNFPVQSQFSQTWLKKTLKENIPTSHEISGDYTQNKLAQHCSRTWLFLNKGNLCGPLKQTESISLVNFITIRGICSWTLILYFYSQFLHINIKYLSYIIPIILSPEYNKYINILKI